MRAKDIMTSPVHTVAPTTPVEVAAELMSSRSITALPVVDAEGRLLGMVSEGDLLWHRVPSDPTAHLRRFPDTDPETRAKEVGELMSPYPVTTHPETDVADVAEVMLEHDVRSLPVLSDGEVVGIISRRDILRTMVRSDDVLTHEVQHRLDEYADGRQRWTANVLGGVATIVGAFADDTEQAVVVVLARTVPGVAAVDVSAADPGNGA
ncbi:MAG: CBS domain-containing protein [Actinoplanes sp.]